MAALQEMTITDHINTQVLMFSVILALTCFLGDRLCSATAQSRLLWRALSDSATHGAVGLVSWAVVVTPGLRVSRWLQCVLCGALASVIDADHFLKAGSLQLQTALTLQERPLCHSTSLILALTVLLWLVSLVLHQPLLRQGALMCSVAWLSHHLRDASRRGLWIPPFGSTPPLPYVLYIVATVVLAVGGHYWYSVYCLRSSVRPQSNAVSVASVVVQ